MQVKYAVFFVELQGHSQIVFHIICLDIFTVGGYFYIGYAAVVTTTLIS